MSRGVAPRSESQQSWRFLVVLFATSAFLEITAWGHLSAFTPYYLRTELGLAEEDLPRWTGLLASSSLILALPLAPLWGVLADRYSRKAVMVRSLLVEALVFTIAAVAQQVQHFLLARVLLGLAFGNNAIALATISLAAPERRVATAISLVQMTFPLGISLGPLLGSFLINLFGVRGMFAVDAGLALSSGLLLAILFREPPVHDVSVSLRQQLAATFRFVGQSPLIRWNFVVAFLTMAGGAMIDPYMPIFISQLYQGANLPTIIGLVLAGYGVVTALSTPVVGRIADRVGPARILTGALLALSLVIATLSQVRTLAQLVGLLLLRGIPHSGANALLYALLAVHVPAERRSAIMGLAPLPRNLAMFLAPGTASLLSAAGLSVIFGASAGVYLLAFGGAAFLLRAAAKATLPPPRLGSGRAEKDER
ncbi:MAG: MFS transporter [Chloroflexi bacterium]|nr:MFS transporter [Chloroflexota bacterium]